MVGTDLARLVAPVVRDPVSGKEGARSCLDVRSDSRGKRRWHGAARPMGGARTSKPPRLRSSSRLRPPGAIDPALRVTNCASDSRRARRS
jgi:hypothetical protein